MKHYLTIPLFAFTLLHATASLADTLILKDGQTLSGTLISKNSDGVVFEIGGQQLKFNSANVQSISFGDAVPSEKAPEEKVIKQADKDFIVPAGTRIVVRTNTALNSKSHATGHKFTARLEADLLANNEVIAPKGATLYGVIADAQQSRRASGNSSLLITFTDIMINNQMYPIQTSAVKAVTESTTKTTAKRTARVAAIGGLLNGSDGAKDGAKIGLGASLLSGGNSINVPAETLLEFQLAAPLSK